MPEERQYGKPEGLQKRLAYWANYSKERRASQ